MRVTTLFIPVLLTLASNAFSQPATQPGVGKFPHIEVNVAQKQVRVECELISPRMPLEFFCVTKGGNEHESVLRTQAKPSQIHTALLMLGLEPGEPVRYSPATKTVFPPHGPPLGISVEYVNKEGKTVTAGANKFMREIKSKKTSPPISWVFAGSKVMPDGVYAADVTGYVVSIVNFELTLIDVPKIASEAQETLEYEIDTDATPAVGTTVTMIIQPLGNAPAVNEQAPATAPSARLSDVTINQPLVDRAKQRWEQDVKPHADSLQKAAQAQYEVLASLRREQQRLIDEADRIQRLIDQMEQDWQQMTTPKPPPN